MDYDTLSDELRQKQQFLDQLNLAWTSEYRQRGGTIFCVRGCSGCCGLVVNCTVPEAAAIAEGLTAAQRAGIYERIPLIRACAEQADSLPKWLRSYRDQAGPCPLLEADGSCGVYQQRPLSCRSLLSTKEPVWCTTDFSALAPEHKQAFLDSLDRSATAFPTHYAATPQEIGRELELALLKDQERRYGCSAVGNLPWLIWLVLEHRLTELLAAGPAALQRHLETAGLLNPYLLLINE